MRHLGDRQLSPLVTNRGILMWRIRIITCLSRTELTLVGFLRRAIAELAGQRLVPVYATARMGYSMSCRSK